MSLIVKVIAGIYFLLQFLFAVWMLLPMTLLIIHFLFTRNRKLLGKKYPVVNEKNYDFAAIITAHQDTRFIKPLVDSFLKQRYGNFIVYIVADDCDVTDLNFENEHIKVLKPETPFHAKIKSIKFAVDNFERAHDVLVVFDSDNLVHPDYLYNLNMYFCCGFKAVQTHMLSKNTDTVYARLDSIGHIYNTFVERQSRMETGLSSSILGLGIAIDTELYKKVLYKDALGGFDKKLQADLIENTTQVAFAKDAIVYDEKVNDGNTLEKQRTRWIYTYFKYFAVNCKLFYKGLKQLNFNKLFFAFTTLRPPLFITISTALLFFVIGLLLNIWIALFWLSLILIYTVSFIAIILTQSIQKGMGQALLYIPAIVFRQVKAFLNIKKAGKDFLKTEHTKVVYIEDVLQNEVV